MPSPAPEKLSQIRADLAEGRTALARARIHGVLSSGAATPEALDLAGDIHLALGDPVRAGAYWWIIDSDDPAHADALKAFRHATRRSPEARIAMAQVATKFDHLKDEFGAHWLADSSGPALAKARGRVLDRKAWKRRRASGEVSDAPPRMPFGCMLAVLTASVFAAIGMLTVWAFLWRVLRGG